MALVSPPKIVVDLASEISNAITASGAKSRSHAAQKVIWECFDGVAQETLKHMDCKKGCYYCCSIPVSAWPMEIFSIAEYVRDQKKHKMLGNLDRFTDRLKKAALDGEDSRWKKRRLCPFLFNESCSIYSVRPLTCRTWMIPKVEFCRKVFNGNEENVPYPEIPIMFQAICNGAVILAGRRFRLDMRLYQFIAAMAHVLSEGLTEESFFDGNLPLSMVPEDTALVTEEMVMTHAAAAATFFSGRSLE